MNIYSKYHVSRVINASGKMTILGGSRVQDKVIEQCGIGAGNFFEVKDLLDKTGEYIANLLDVESSYIVNSASGRPRGFAARRSRRKPPRPAGRRCWRTASRWDSASRAGAWAPIRPFLIMLPGKKTGLPQ